MFGCCHISLPQTLHLVLAVGFGVLDEKECVNVKVVPVLAYP
jgi:hypothetical protein